MDNSGTECSGVEGLNKRSKKKEKKPRNPNFGKDEAELIFRETGKRARLLVDRHGPGVSEEKKKKFWASLAKKVTALNGNKYERTATQVKKKWQTTRSSCKAKVRSNVHEKNKTGGGQAVQTKLSEAEELFLQNIPIAPENIHGVPGAIETNRIKAKKKSKEPSSSSHRLAEIRRTKSSSHLPSTLGQPPTSCNGSGSSCSIVYVPETQQISAVSSMATSTPKRSPIQFHGIIGSSLRVANSIDSDQISDTSTVLDLDVDDSCQGRNTDSLLDKEIESDQEDIFVVGLGINNNTGNDLDKDDSNAEVQQQTLPNSESESEPDDDDLQLTLSPQSDHDQDAGYAEEEEEEEEAQGSGPRQDDPDQQAAANNENLATGDGDNLGPIRSNRTVTRDLRRQEFKAIIERQDRMAAALERSADAQQEICRLLATIVDKMD